MASSKFKVCRRISENIWTHKKLTPKQTAIIWKLKKRVPRKQSDFAMQLQHSTKLSLFYGNLRSPGTAPFGLYHKTNTFVDKTKRLLFRFETRLDVILFRLNLAPTLFTARQFIAHKKISINNIIVNVPGISLSNGDIISVLSDHFDLVRTTIIANQHNSRVFMYKPSHLEVNYNTLKAILLYEPSLIQFPFKIELDILF
jgi:small subunit ribosomal protein S4